LTSSIIARNISTKEVTVYFSEISFPSTIPTTRAILILATG
jgi:hypothetical protein